MNDPVSMVLAVSVLCFFGGVALAAGLCVGWHVASLVVGPIQVKVNNNITIYKTEPSEIL